MSLDKNNFYIKVKDLLLQKQFNNLDELDQHYNKISLLISASSLTLDPISWIIDKSFLENQLELLKDSEQKKELKENIDKLMQQKTAIYLIKFKINRINDYISAYNSKDRLLIDKLLENYKSLHEINEIFDFEQCNDIDYKSIISKKFGFTDIDSLKKHLQDIRKSLEYDIVQEQRLKGKYNNYLSAPDADRILLIELKQRINISNQYLYKNFGIAILEQSKAHLEKLNTIESLKYTKALIQEAFERGYMACINYIQVLYGTSVNDVESFSKDYMSRINKSKTAIEQAIANPYNILTDGTTQDKATKYIEILLNTYKILSTTPFKDLTEIQLINHIATINRIISDQGLLIFIQDLDSHPEHYPYATKSLEENFPENKYDSYWEMIYLGFLRSSILELQKELKNMHKPKNKHVFIENKPTDIQSKPINPPLNDTQFLKMENNKEKYPKIDIKDIDIISMDISNAIVPVMSDINEKKYQVSKIVSNHPKLAEHENIKPIFNRIGIDFTKNSIAKWQNSYIEKFMKYLSMSILIGLISSLVILGLYKFRPNVINKILSKSPYGNKAINGLDKVLMICSNNKILSFASIATSIILLYICSNKASKSIKEKNESNIKFCTKYISKEVQRSL